MPADHLRIAELIRNRPLCLECIAHDVELTLSATDEVVRDVGRAQPVDVVPRSRCRGLRADPGDVLHQRRGGP